MNKKKILCYCNDEKHYDCFKEELSPLYPGQTLTVSFYANINITKTETIIVETDIKQPYATSCIMINAKENIQFIGKSCTAVKYTIAFPTNDWCELTLKMSQTRAEYNIFYIRELPCPFGFVKIDGTCQCYPSFVWFGFTNCDINTQTILRPSKGWVSMNTENQSMSCYISKQCSFDYCKPYSFYLNLSAPDSQCQFNRSGLLCGQCKEGL